jgi:dihydrofolate reductase
MSTGMDVVLVAALGRNRVIGADGTMPWHVPEDLRRFKALTMGHPMVMGRATFDSIGRPLPGRRTIVLTRDPSWSRAGVEVAASLDEALAIARLGGAEPDPVTAVMVVGGGTVYEQALPFADRLELTLIDASPAGDTLFPDISGDEWEERHREDHPGYAFVTLTRRRGA